MFKDEAVRNEIKNKVNFRAQKVLYFRWSGSGGDKITYRTKKDKKDTQVHFLYTAGLTDDLRHHARVFAIRRGVEWTVKRK